MTNDIVALTKAYVNTGDALKTVDKPATRGERTFGLLLSVMEVLAFKTAISSTACGLATHTVVRH